MSSRSLPGHRPLLGTLVAAGTIALAACGGGGGGSGDTAPVAGVPATATASFTPSQAAATALVRDAEQRTRDLRLASGLTAGLATGQSWTGERVPLAAWAARRTQAVQDYSSVLCSAGSATLDVAQTILDRFAADPAASLDPGEGLSMTARRCVVKAAADLGAVALGSFGTGATIDGSFTLTLTTHSGNDLLWTLKYAGFTYTPYGGTAYAPLDATLVFGTVGGVDRYTLDMPDVRFLKAPTVSQLGNAVTVAAGSLRGALPASAGSGYADYAYAGWTLDAATLSATGGTVTVSGAAGATATVTASATGYTVRFGGGGLSTATYSVAH